MGRSNSQSWWDPKSPLAIAKKRKRSLWRGRAKAASPVRRIDPQTGEIVEIIPVPRLANCHPPERPRPALN
jgi:hypothetical protein